MADETIELATMIKALRQTLAEAIEEGADKDVRFLLQETELELSMSMTHEANAGVKFYVFKTGVGGSTNQSQRIKLKLKPIRATTKPDGTEGFEEVAISSASGKE